MRHTLSSFVSSNKHHGIMTDFVFDSCVDKQFINCSMPGWKMNWLKFDKNPANSLLPT